MTTAELIAKLSELPGEDEVLIAYDGGWCVTNIEPGDVVHVTTEDDKDRLKWTFRDGRSVVVLRA